MFKVLRLTTVLILVGLVLAASAVADDKIRFKDPRGDDNGPGNYSYPTDAVYTAGSFDLTEFEMKIKGDKAEINVDVAARLEDPWRMGVGFSVQMVFVFIDTDGEEGSGFTEVPPGLNFTFAPEDAWDACIILSPQSMSRVIQERDAKAGTMASAIIVPKRTKGARSTISASVKLEEIGEGDPKTWGYQVVMQSNEGFPAGGDLLTRKVNEFEGQHRFGGGTDYDCDPHVMDILIDNTPLGDYECNEGGTTKKLAVIPMVHQ